MATAAMERVQRHRAKTTITAMTIMIAMIVTIVGMIQPTIAAPVWLPEWLTDTDFHDIYASSSTTWLPKGELLNGDGAAERISREYDTDGLAYYMDENPYSAGLAVDKVEVASKKDSRAKEVITSAPVVNSEQQLQLPRLRMENGAIAATTGIALRPTDDDDVGQQVRQRISGDRASSDLLELVGQRRYRQQLAKQRFEQGEKNEEESEELYDDLESVFLGSDAEEPVTVDMVLSEVSDGSVRSIASSIYRGDDDGIDGDEEEEEEEKNVVVDINEDLASISATMHRSLKEVEEGLPMYNSGNEDEENYSDDEDEEEEEDEGDFGFEVVAATECGDGYDGRNAGQRGKLRGALRACAYMLRGTEMTQKEGTKRGWRVAP